MWYERIVFCQGDDATEPLDILNAYGEEAAIEYLAEWDMEPGEVFEESASGDSDAVYETDDGFRLSYNQGLGYIGLERIVEEDSSDD